MLGHILYRILSRFRIWPQNWPRRSHFRAPPHSFLRLFKSVEHCLHYKPFGFWGFQPKKLNHFLTYFHFNNQVNRFMGLEIFCRLINFHHFLEVLTNCWIFYLLRENVRFYRSDGYCFDSQTQISFPSITQPICLQCNGETAERRFHGKMKIHLICHN